MESKQSDIEIEEVLSSDSSSNEEIKPRWESQMESKQSDIEIEEVLSSDSSSNEEIKPRWESQMESKQSDIEIEEVLSSDSSSNEEIKPRSTNWRSDLLEKTKKTDDVVLLEIITEKREKLSTSPPSRIQTNSRHFIDMTGLDMDDIKADGNGKFKNDGIFYWKYQRNEDNEFRCIKTKHRKGQKTSCSTADEFIVCKSYFVHRDHRDFKRQILFVEDSHNKYVNNTCVVTYSFDGPEHAITLQPHGNAKYRTHEYTYTRVKPSAIANAATNSVRERSVRGGIEQHISQHGGRASIAAENYPNTDQLYRHGINRTTSAGTSNNFADITLWAEENKDICRLVQLHPHPAIVLATEQQLNDLERFATGKESKAISVDPTFNIGEFFVTPITYQHQFISSQRTGTKGCFCGPMLIHFDKKRITYQLLFDTLIRERPSISEINRVGTDGEHELITGIKASLPNTKMIRCNYHFEKNVMEQLKKCGLAFFEKTVKQHITRLINSNQFENTFAETLEFWNTKSTQMAKYLEKRKDVIWNDLHVRVNGGEVFTTNMSESVNSKLKRFTGGRSMGLYNFLELSIKLFAAEQGSIQDTYIRRSSTYTIPDSMSDTISLSEFTTLPSETRSQALQLRNTLSTTDVESISMSQIKKDMIKKAENMVGNSHIVQIPNMQPNIKAYSCLSTTGTKNHTVTVRDSGKGSCDCPAHKCYNICSHSIGAAHLSNKLSSHLKQQRGSSSSKALSVSVRAADRAGQKPHQRKRVRSNTQPQRAPCDHDFSTLLVDLEGSRIRKCYQCKCGFDQEKVSHVIGKKIYRSFHTAHGPKTTVTREWAYTHIECFSGDKVLHVCPDHTVPENMFGLLRQHGFLV